MSYNLSRYELPSTKKLRLPLCFSDRPLWAADKPTTPSFFSPSSLFPHSGCKHRRLKKKSLLSPSWSISGTLQLVFILFRQQGNSLVESRQSYAGQTLMGPEWNCSHNSACRKNLFVSTGGVWWASRGHSCLTRWSRFTCTAWRWGRSATRVTWAGPWLAASRTSSTSLSHTDDSGCCSAVGPDAALYTPETLILFSNPDQSTTIQNNKESKI